MIRLSDEEFDEVARTALDTLPEAFKERLEHVWIEVEALPDRATIRKVGLHSRWQLLGLFHGVPLTHESVSDPGRLPNRITLYRENILRICRTRAQVAEQVRKTVLHEIGHHFGLGEADLRELGY